MGGPILPTPDVEDLVEVQPGSDEGPVVADSCDLSHSVQDLGMHLTWAVLDRNLDTTP